MNAPANSEPTKIMFHFTAGQKKTYRSPNRLKNTEAHQELQDARCRQCCTPQQDQVLHSEQAGLKKRDAHIAVCPAGRMETALLDAILSGITRRFGIRARVSMELSDLMFAYHKERKQYHSTAVLGKLAEMAHPSAVKVLAVTHVDLFIPILTHVPGEAQLGGKACIISTFRFRGEDRQGEYVERMINEAAHELCHCFDLRHCKDPSCVMHVCRDATEVDKRSGTLCRYCSIMFKDRLKRGSDGESLAIEPSNVFGEMNTELTACTVTSIGEAREEEFSTGRNERIIARRSFSM